MRTPFDDAVAVLVDLAREGFSRGWDRLDRADKHEAIAAAIGGIHAEWSALTAELRTLRTRCAAMEAVVQAVARWHGEMDFEASRAPGEVFTCEESLADEFDEYRRAAKAKEGT